MSPVLEIADLTLRHPGTPRPQLQGFRALLEPGNRLVLVGESGAGKSTLIAAISGFLRPRQGRLLVGGIDPYSSGADRRRVRRLLGQVPQDPVAALDPTMRLLEAVAEPLIHLRGMARDHAREEAARSLAALGLGKELHWRRPGQLSGGQCQRAAMVRALVHRPPLVLADEPTASLDPLAGRRLLLELRALTMEHRLALLHVTHDLDEPLLLRGQLAVLLGGLCVEQVDEFVSWEQLRHPYSRYLATARTRPVPPLIPAPTTGCPFANNCDLADPLCHQEQPPIRQNAQGTTHLRCFAMDG